MKYFLSILLAVLLCFNGVFTSVRANTNVTTDGQGETQISLEDVDSSTAKSPKMDLTEEPQEVEEEHDPNEIVRVSIVLTSKSTLEKYPNDSVVESAKARSYRAALEKEQTRVAERISKAIGEELEVVRNLTLAANIISAEVTYGEIEEIKKISGVLDVWVEQQYQADDDTDTTITTGEMIFAQSAWADGYTGAGQLVAIIDTGTNDHHISFSGEALEYSLTKDGKSLSDYDLLTKEDITKAASQLNASIDVDKVYESLKVPYAYNYVDENYNTDHASDSQGEHGSHVSGIAAANRYVKVDGEFVDAITAVQAVGVAPDAQIITMKVFGAGGGAYDADYMAAIEDAIVLGADSVNLSLGAGNPGSSFSRGYQNIMDNIVSSQTVVVMSAGNSYNWSAFSSNVPGGYLYGDDVQYQTDGTPGSFVNTLAVASADNIGMTGCPVVFNGSQTVFYTETSGYGNPAMTSIAGDYEYVYIDAAGEEAQYAAVAAQLSLEGKVVICNRGAISFYVKVNNAQPYGAKAVIIANNTDGTISINLTGLTYAVPAVSITLADAQTIKANSTEVAIADAGFSVYTGTISISASMSSAVTTDRSEATMSDFSSWGIPSGLTLKPEITAPGGGIWSVNGMEDDTYEDMSGTSMAAPHVTGMAAVLAQYIEENDLTTKTGESQRTLINSLLMSTATPMIDSYGYYYSVLEQGSGLADVYAATKSLSYIMMGEDATASYADGKVKVELGDDPDRTGTYSYTFKLTNFSEEELEYELDSEFFTQALYNYQGTLLLCPDTDYLDATVEYTFDNEIAGHDVDKDGDTDTDDAVALLDYVSGKVDGSELDLDAGEFDGVEGISSYDAEQLLEWLEAEEERDTLILQPGETKEVTVDIQLEDLDVLNQYYENGLYVEGYTYVTCVSETEDGEILDVEKTIPVIGFYGSWTDPSMYDTSYVETLYEGQKTYSGVSRNNYVTITYPTDSTASYFVGNPYIVEDEFPADRLAISSDTTIGQIRYTLVRQAGTVGALGYKVNADGTAGSTIFSGSVSNYVSPEYYYVNGSAWQGTSGNAVNVNKKVSALGLSEGDVFNIGVFAIPEYYAMDTLGALTASGFETLVKSGDLGAGAEMGYTLTVDNTAPVVTSAELSEDGNTLTVKVQDNNYIAFVALMDALAENVVVAGVVPEQSAANEEVTLEFDLSNYEGAQVCIVAADYAANETYKLATVGEGELVDESAVSKIVVTPSTISLKMGVTTTAQATANVYPAYCSDKSVTWTSADESIATVDANGVVTAVGKGTTTITATSNSTPTVSGSATVKVSGPSVNVQYTRGSTSYFYAIDVDTKATTTLGRGYYSNSPYVGGGRDNKYVVGFDTDSYLAVYDVSNSYQYIEDYEYDFSSGSLASYVCVDLANFPENTGVDYDFIGVTTAGRLVFCELESGSLGAFNLGSYLSDVGGTFVAITFVGTFYNASLGQISAYYALTADGTVYVLYLYVTANGLSARFGPMGKVSGIDMGTDLTAFSMTYAGGITGEDAVYVCDDNTKTIYYVQITEDEEFTSSVFYTNTRASRLSGLYDDFFDAVAAVNSVAVTTSLEELTEVAPTESAELVVASNRVKEVATEEAEGSTDSVVATAPVNTLRDMPRVNLSKVETADDEESDNVNVVYTEETDVNNGVVTVTYDPEEVKFVEVKTDVEYTSINEEEGSVTLAYAQTTAIAAGETIATFVFEPVCEDVEVTVTVKELNDNLTAGEGEDVTIPGIGHDYQFVEFQWNSDNTAAKALFVCANDESHTLLIDAEIAEEIVEEATTEKAGKKIVTATVTYGDETYSDEKEITIPKIKTAAETGDFAVFATASAVMGISFIALVVAIILKKKATSKLN